MASYAKVKLSASTNGKGIKVTAITNGTANTIHTAIAGTDDMDEAWIYALNQDTAYQYLYLLWGGTTEPDDLVQVSIPPLKGAVLVIPGWLLQNGLVIKAYAETTNQICINGFVNRIYSSGS